MTMLTMVSVALLLSGSHPARSQTVLEEERSPFFEEERSARLGSCQWFTEEDDLTYLPTNPEEVRIVERLDLTLEETIDCGFFGNRRLQVAYIRLAEKQEEWRQVRAEYVPDVTLRVSPILSGLGRGTGSEIYARYDFFQDNVFFKNDIFDDDSDILVLDSGISLDHTILS
ncbi:hypothetical protein, partial [Okeania sp. SIO2G5]|uniref:hypothetical protein n=1 Tax=Okeania sp. SIO2G5 TaxID=2607796 RepID=UPI0013C0BCD3